ncbi:MAG: DUF2064 domain-containing protein [Acidobacteriota bacterium]
MLPFPRRAVILFSRSPREEEAAKHLPQVGFGARGLFSETRRRLAGEIARGLPETRLLLAGGGELPEGALRLVQHGDTFAERVDNALRDAAELGFQEIVLIAGDVPGLRAFHLHAAFAALSDRRIALGPSPDGGVYLIGLRAEAQDLVEGVRWRTPHVLSDLRRRAALRGCPAVVLAPLRDIDSRLDLPLLLSDPELDLRSRSIVRSLVHTETPPRPPRLEARPLQGATIDRPIRGPPPPDPGYTTTV